MKWQYTPYVLPLLLSTVMSVVLVVLFLWRQRHVPGATPLMWFLWAAAEWSLGYALELSSSDVATKLFWAKVEYLGIVVAPMVWLILVLQYTAREKWLSRRNLILLTVMPLTTVLVAWTNSLHHLLYRSTYLDTSGLYPMLGLNYGPWFWINITYSYLLLALGALLLLRMFLRARPFYRAQIGIMLIGASIPWLGNMVYISGLNPFPHLDLTPFGYTLTGLAATWGLLHFRLLDVVPVARATVIENMAASVIVLDTHNRIVDLNPAAQHIIGRSTQDAIGQPIGRLVTAYPDLIERYRSVTEAHAEISWPGDVRSATGDGQGSLRYFDLHISSLHNRHGRFTGRLVVLHEITERVRAEKALQYRAEFERLITELSTYLINLAPTELDRGINYGLRKIGEFAGVDRSYVFLFDAGGTKVNNTYEWCAEGIEPQIDNLQGIPVEAFSWWMERIKRFEHIYIPRVDDLPPEANSEKEILQSQGIRSLVVVPLVFSKSLLGFLGFDSVRKERQWSADIIALLRVTGDIIANVLEHKRAEAQNAAVLEELRQSNRRLEKALVELKAAQEQMVEQERMAAVGRLAVGLAHDYNNLMAPIILYSDMMLKYSDLTSKDRQRLTAIRQQGRRAADLTQQILDFASKAILRRQDLDLVTFISERKDSLKHMLPENIQIILDGAKGVTVRADPGRLQQALVNLALNARDAMPAGGELHIGLRRIKIETGDTAPLPQMKSGEWAQITVSDTGTGIPPDVLPHIFEPFFTTRVPFGRGLGLSQVYGIIKQHAGYIDVTTELGVGTTFTIYLPALPFTSVTAGG